MCRASLLLAAWTSYAVGYQDNTLRKGYTMITPTFINVGGGDLDIDKMLIIKGATADQQCSINVMDEDGKWIGTYYWMLEAEVEGVTYPAGWCDGLYNPSGVTLKPGQAVYFSTSREGLSFETAGQVDGVTLNLDAGYTMIGNATPLALDADKMVINGATADQQCSINVMDEDGKWIGTYYWMLEAEVEGVTYPAGWCDGLYNPSGITLNPGESVYFSTSRTGLSMTIKSPLEKAEK